MVRLVTRNRRELKVRCYSCCLIYPNEYLDALPGAKANENTSAIELNKILLKSITNGWSHEDYVHSFDCETVI